MIGGKKAILAFAHLPVSAEKHEYCMEDLELLYSLAAAGLEGPVTLCLYSLQG